MKKFLVKIWAYKHHASFEVEAEDNAVSIEQSILDKLGKNEVIFEKNGFTSNTGKWITYEEVTNDRRPLHYKEVLGARVATRAPEGREA